MRWYEADLISPPLHVNSQEYTPASLSAILCTCRPNPPPGAGPIWYLPDGINVDPLTDHRDNEQPTSLDCSTHLKYGPYAVVGEIWVGADDIVMAAIEQRRENIPMSSHNIQQQIATSEEPVYRGHGNMFGVINN